MFSSLSFAAPWALAALAALPVIYFLLRLTPPSPKRVRFPAIRLLFGLREDEQTPARTPLWLVIFRLLLAALVIFALAEPILGTSSVPTGNGPIVAFVDNGWAAAENWDARKSALDELIDRAERDGRQVVIVPTAKRVSALEIAPMSPGDARARADALLPEPFGTDRASAAAALAAAHLENPEIVWLSDGIDDGGGKEAVQAIASLGPLSVLRDPVGSTAIGVTRAVDETRDFAFRVIRSETGAPFKGMLHALSADGRFLGEAPFEFAKNDRVARAVFDLPLQLRNEVARVAVESHESAGAVVLMDESSRLRPVGIVSGAQADRAQPLLSDVYYLTRALEPYAEIRKGTLQELLAGGLSLLILSDVGKVVGEDHDRVAKWLENGGVLLRFAGPRLASESDDLVPVTLRTGGRALGGAMSWEKPQGLGGFAEDSPFAGLRVPGDVTVTRQVLAQPSVDLGEKTWVRLADGTPLVTAERRGKGTIVLVHVTANPDWSTLPLSGLFVDMLRRTMALAHGVAPAGAAAPETMLPPRATLDGYGRLGAPPPTATPIKAGDLNSLEPGPSAPPGFYGRADAPAAFNLLREDALLAPLPDIPGASVSVYGETEVQALKDPLLALALALLIVDLLISLWLRGLLPRLRHAPAAVAILAIVLAPHFARAQAGDDFALRASLETRLAYVVTGDAATDEMSRAGLEGLTQVLNERTAVEAAPPIAVDVERDELAFFPLLYWPMPPNGQSLSPEALEKIDAFMKNGGTILFDTRDGDRAIASSGGAGQEVLRRLLHGLDIPPLVTVPEGHILTKAFYLLSDFPGRYASGQIWVEAPRQSDEGVDDPNAATAWSSDGVSSIIIGSNDWAAAWARDDSGRPLAAVTPGGERQRELAMRFGVNLVMYTLTGNYKSDQVHVPALLERLGQ